MTETTYSIADSFAAFTAINSMKTANQLQAEIEEGNCEYKYKLTNLSKEQLLHRISQLEWRLNESLINGESAGNYGQIAIYQIGFEDDGSPTGLTKEELEESITNLEYMAQCVGCTLTIQKVLAANSPGLMTAEIMLKKMERETIGAIQIQIAVAGDTDAGKSSLIGVLLSGEKDNGKGLSRTHVFRHNHEVQSGSTSSISHHSIYFNMSGEILNHVTSVPGSRMRLRSKSDIEYADMACRIVSLLDLAGSVKYLKSTVKAIFGYQPTYCILCISILSLTGDNPRISSMTLEHLGMALTLGLRVAVVITKSDLTNEPIDVQEDLIIKYLQKLLKAQGYESNYVKSLEQIVTLVLESSLTVNQSKPVIPIFFTSSVTGQGLDLLHSYMFQLPLCNKKVVNNNTIVEARVIDSFSLVNITPNTSLNTIDDTTITSLTDSNPSISSDNYKIISNIKVVDNLIHNEIALLVIVKKGFLSLRQYVLIGPCSRGLYYPVKVHSLRVNDIPVRNVLTGQCATIILEPVVDDNYDVNVLDDVSSMISLRRSPVGLVVIANINNADNDEIDHESNIPKYHYNDLIVPSSAWEFDVRLVIVNHPGKVKLNYAPVIHVDNIHQSAKLIDISSPIYSKANPEIMNPIELSNGDRAICRFKFLYRPEFLHIGSPLVVRDGRIRAIGHIINIYSASS